jgi:hypothetical protein
VAVLAAVSVEAQTALGVGAAVGTVLDPSGAPVGSAKVTLTEKSKRLVREIETSSSGSFLFPAINAGVYSLQVEKPGFNTERLENLRIEVGQPEFITVKLIVGDVKTDVTVQAPGIAELSAESNTIGSLVDSARVQELPLNGRNFLQLALLAGDTNEINSATDAFTSNVGPPGRIVVLPGAVPYSAAYSLNGMNIRGSRDGELALSPSVAAVDQFRVQASFLMPDQGVGSSVVNIVTKSGSNRFSGEIFEFFRNKALDARSFFAPGREDLKRNQFGGAVGGPLHKDRVWFHTFYEGSRELTAFSAAGYAPTTAMFGGNFAETGRIIYDPASFRADTRSRQPFPNFSIPLERINPVSRSLLEYYRPGSSLGSRPNNLFGNPKKTLRDDQGGIRVDAALSTHSQLFGQFFSQRTPSTQPGLFPLSGLLYQNEGTLAMLQHSWSLSANAVNTLRFGFLRNFAVGGNEGRDLGPILQQIGITNTFDANGVSAVNLQGYSSFGRANGDVGNRDNTWQLDEEFSLNKGAHSLAFGAGLRYRRGWHLNGNSGALGSLSFQPAFTTQLASNAQGQLVPMANTGDSFADFLTGLPVNGLLVGLPVVQFRATQFSPFFQDTWKVTRNLTFNYGVSWFFETPPDPQGWARDLVHGFNRNTGLLTYAGLGQISPQSVAPDKNNFAPRFGLAWSPTRSTVIRAAAGLYYSEFPWLFAAYPITAGSPVGAGQNFTNALTNPVPTYTLGANIFPPAPSASLSTYAASLPAGSVVTLLDPNFRTNYASQWNVSVQQSLGRNDSIELSYLGTSAHRLPNVLDLAQCRPGPDLYCDPASRPWPRYGLLLYVDSSGNSSNEALISKYEHRIDKSLNLRFEYTLAKALSDGWQAVLASSNQITDCRGCSKGPATFDVRHRAVASAVWEVPSGGNRDSGLLPGWVHTAAGGWTISAITTFSSGQPVNLKGPNQTGSPFISHLPNRICDGRSDQISDNIRNNGFLWFETSCFSVPPVGYFGNSGATVLYGPGISNWDLGIEKSFALRETTRIQFRAEMFNAWNHAQFQQPNGDAGAGPNFGRISATRPPRLIQLALKLLW